MASKLINDMMPIVMQNICENEVLRRKLFQVNYHTTLSGHALVTMIYHKKLLDFQTEWEKVALQLRCGSNFVEASCHRAKGGSSCVKLMENISTASCVL